MRAFFVFAVFAAACGGGATRAPGEPVANTPPPAAEVEQPVEPAPVAKPTPPAEPLSVAPLPPLSDAEFEAMTREVIELFVAVGTAIDAARGDCAKAGTGLETVVAERRDFLQRMKRYEQDPVVSGKMRQWMQDHIGEFMPSAMKLAEAGQTCMNDPGFAAAMKRMESSN